MGNQVCSQKQKIGRWSPWVWGMLLIVLVAVIANSKMIWSAMHVQVRMLDENFSVKDHKPMISASEQNDKHYVEGWHVSLHSPQQVQNDAQATADTMKFIVQESPTDFKLELRDGENNPVKNEEVFVMAQWPSNASQDFTGRLYETSYGHYEGSLHFPRPGNWDIRIMATHNQAKFATEQRVFVLAVH